MPSWLRRLFSRTYRNALAAEAAGDYARAAESYALASMPEKVAEMHLLRADRVQVAQRAAALLDARRWFERARDEGRPVDSTVASRLAKALVQEAEARTEGDPRRSELAVAAAEVYEAADRLTEAGRAYELAGKLDGAVRCYEAAGEIETMERLLERESRKRATATAVRAAFDEYEEALARGARDRAREALLRCCTLAPEQGYEEKLEELDDRFPERGVVELRQDGSRWIVIGTTPAFIGRGEAHLRLRHVGISRRHAAIDVDGRGFHLRDAGSRNGTLLGGLPVAGSILLEGSGVIGLGDHCSVQFRVLDEALELEVLDGADRGLRAVVVRERWLSPDRAFSLFFRDERAVVTAASGGALRLEGRSVDEGVVLLRGDRIEAPDGSVLEVLG